MMAMERGGGMGRQTVGGADGRGTPTDGHDGSCPYAPVEPLRPRVSSALHRVGTAPARWVGTARRSVSGGPFGRERRGCGP